MNSQFLYRVQIVEYPEGALITDENDPRCGEPDPDWKPEGWDPEEYWIDTHGRGSANFFWPSTYKEWRSRGPAVARKALIESYGAKAIVQRSAEIVWPEDGFETVLDGLRARAGLLREGGAS
ncbi:hypothetical protein [Nocardia wallacei]|uniref:hypothetical protein n=1 Tax=Nocardia wallacei TaxID=480035 RepID=UPI0024576299|nr:hypothetical protein [Nocardia wallacei]